MRNSSRWAQNGKETKIALYYKATLHHLGKEHEKSVEKREGATAPIIDTIRVGEVAVPLDSLFPAPSSS